MKYLDSLRERHKAAGESDKIGARFGRLFEQAVKEEPDQGGRMLITAIATTSGVDLENEVIIPSGADVSYFSAARAVYYCHDTYSLPVASLRNLAMLPDKSGWRVQASTLSTEFARDVATCIAEGAINGGSIGFLRTSAGTPTKEELAKYGPCEYVTREWKWLEWSVTPFPCNPEAMIESAAMGKSLDGAAEIVRGLASKGLIARKSADLMGFKRKVVLVKQPYKINLTTA